MKRARQDGRGYDDLGPSSAKSDLKWGWSRRQADLVGVLCLKCRSPVGPGQDLCSQCRRKRKPKRQRGNDHQPLAMRESQPAKTRIFTVGHSDQQPHELVGLLRQHGVTAVVDLRSHPWSAWASQFNRAAIRTTLKQRQIRYAFMGDSLGARPMDPAHYENGKVVYQRLAASPQYRQGIELLIANATRERIALMCSEQDPFNCHRAILIAPELERAGLEVQHLLNSGELITQRDLTEQLLHRERLDRPDLLQGRAERVALAFERRGNAIAWKKPTESRPAPIEPTSR